MGTSNAFSTRLDASQLGSKEFRQAHGVRLAYVAGAMYKGIASVELVSAMANADLLSFYGSGGMSLESVQAAVRQIQHNAPDKPFGVNLLHSPELPAAEMALVDLLLDHQVRAVEASAFMDLSLAIVRYRLAGAYLQPDGTVTSRHAVLAKVSRLEVAERFLSPAPQKIVTLLVEQGFITAEQAKLADRLPVASDVTVEADSAGHTDMGVMVTLLPAIMALRDETQKNHQYDVVPRVGAAGGIGTPQAAAAAFVLGADYILTGSLNQCTPQAGTSETVKEMLASMGVRDTAYAPAGDMFELGARVQVLKKGLLFSARANRLYELWRRHERLEDIDLKTRQEIQDKFFGRSFEDVWQETQRYYERLAPAEIERALEQPRVRMAMIFKWYFVHSTRLALEGDLTQKSNFQIHCGPALGAFNQWVKATALEDWRARDVAVIANTLMQGTASYLQKQLAAFQ